MSAGDKPGFVVRQEPDRVDRKTLRRVAALSVLAFVAALAATAHLLGTADRGRSLGRAEPASMPSDVGTVERSLVLATERGLTERREQRASLDRWGWVDRDAGIARIPIDRAMDVLAAQSAAQSSPLTDGGAPP